MCMHGFKKTSLQLFLDMLVTTNRGIYRCRYKQMCENAKDASLHASKQIFCHIESTSYLDIHSHTCAQVFTNHMHRSNLWYCDVRFSLVFWRSYSVCGLRQRHSPFASIPPLQTQAHNFPPRRWTTPRTAETQARAISPSRSRSVLPSRPTDARRSSDARCCQVGLILSTSFQALPGTHPGHTTSILQSVWKAAYLHLYLQLQLQRCL